MRTVVAEGVWCEECEIFEVPDWDGSRCMNCGCSDLKHVEAEVVGIE